MIAQIDSTAELIVTIGAAAAVLATLYKWAWHGSRDKYTGKRRPGALRRAMQTFAGIRDAILGRDAIVHPDTHEELAPAVLGIGARMAQQETETSEIKDAIVSLADSVSKLADLRAAHERLEERVADIERKDRDRALARTESIELLRTIETAIAADPKQREPEQRDVG